ncbi:hypothetical protein O6H91_18G052300 [Diphasiastrum complanatum]|uniref:Uncharacterized protein n=2 Tax=Diphasiastrum complanatum TaxID=34168 RepID=A0ACC2B172_DIPCM|nr:hypothetical protein O6H91_18G052300 [Diphasiastrum complanatum]
MAGAASILRTAATVHSHFAPLFLTGGSGRRRRQQSWPHHFAPHTLLLLRPAACSSSNRIQIADLQFCSGHRRDMLLSCVMRANGNGVNSAEAEDSGLTALQQLHSQLRLLSQTDEAHSSSSTTSSLNVGRLPCGFPKDASVTYTQEEEIQQGLIAQMRKLQDQTVARDAIELQASSNSDAQENTRQSMADAEGKGSSTVQNDLEEGDRMRRVCDRLIEVFLVDKPHPGDWRKLLAFSEEWSNIRPWFFQRCKTRAKIEEDFGKKADILKMARKLKEVDDDMIRHNELFQELERDSMQLDSLVAKRRKDFTTDFFEYLGILCSVYSKEPPRQNEIAEVATKAFASVQAYDKSAKDGDALTSAQLKLDDILSSPSLDAACRKIDQLARKQELDSTLMLLVTKAWASAKESTMMKEEVKDILYHLYTVARGNLQRLVPKEVRIIRYLLSIEDPKERFAALTDAFSPGEELEGKDIDHLYTTPEKLHLWMKTVLGAYYSKKHGTLVKEAQKLMDPNTIRKLEALKVVVENQFM